MFSIQLVVIAISDRATVLASPLHHFEDKYPHLSFQFQTVGREHTVAYIYQSSFLCVSKLVNKEKITMKNNSEKSAVNAAQFAAYPTLSQINVEKNKQEYLEMFWTDQQREMENVNDFKSNLLLPPNRIKKIMKTEKDVRMIAAESPVLLAKACELFIQELTLCSWLNAQENHRRILKKDDVTDVIMQTDNLGFLVYDATHDGSTPSVVPFNVDGGSNGQNGNNLDH
ncbi:nuclear transcription factor Y subunit C-2-like [Solanum stenotomum]|uniref:nuclear transcription factor Y subunit C-2-like n=1 Tax=Solanum stenotomum TaxID=172797 RepID=UPI0020D0C10F|nr:nuclear transcription factor Y subunit C-2-like [Solanum stenotomum]